jgi:hypothetical protein
MVRPQSTEKSHTLARYPILILLEGKSTIRISSIISPKLKVSEPHTLGRSSMEKVQDVKGLGGMLNGFRELVGSPGFCTPFALFLGYPVRDKELAFVPGLNKEKARKIISTEYGLEFGDKSSADADVVVVLGGMAMPKIGVKPEEMKDFLTTIKYKKLIGVCFMSIFEKAGWCQTLDYDCVMNLIIEGDVSK